VSLPYILYDIDMCSFLVNFSTYLPPLIYGRAVASPSPLVAPTLLVLFFQCVLELGDHFGVGDDTLQRSHGDSFHVDHLRS
jgi:hypothetical protein